jgi:hypothetical protein
MGQWFLPVGALPPIITTASGTVSFSPDVSAVVVQLNAKIRELTRERDAASARADAYKACLTSALAERNAALSRVEALTEALNTLSATVDPPSPQRLSGAFWRVPKDD